MVELSPSLSMRRTCAEPSPTTSKSYLGLPQLCARQPGGTPLVPAGTFDQSSTRNRGPCADTREALAASRSRVSQPRRIVCPPPLYAASVSSLDRCHEFLMARSSRQIGGHSR